MQGTSFHLPISWDTSTTQSSPPAKKLSGWFSLQFSYCWWDTREGQNSCISHPRTLSPTVHLRGAHQASVVGPLEILLHDPVIEPNPGVLVPKAYGEKGLMACTVKVKSTQGCDAHRAVDGVLPLMKLCSSREWMLVRWPARRRQSRSASSQERRRAKYR